MHCSMSRAQHSIANGIIHTEINIEINQTLKITKYRKSRWLLYFIVCDFTVFFKLRQGASE